jgi:cytoskeletal protein CcmA (bactofilin family)
MSLSSFGRREGDSEAQAGKDQKSRKATGSIATGAPGGLTAFIDRGSDFEGKLSFEDTVRIDGRFRGEITSENTLIVGEGGEIAASIRSRNVVVSGLVEGNIVATERLALHKTAHVTGDVETPTLVIEEGATLNGQIKMTDAQKAAAKPAQASASPAKPASADPSEPKASS